MRKYNLFHKKIIESIPLDTIVYWIYKSAEIRPSLGEASAYEIGRCSEMSKDTKEYNRWGRHKALFNAAGEFITP